MEYTENINRKTNRPSFIRFSARPLRFDENGKIRCVRIGSKMESTTDALRTDEIQHVIAALSHIVPSGIVNNNFTYTFPFQL